MRMGLIVLLLVVVAQVPAVEAREGWPRLRGTLCAAGLVAPEGADLGARIEALSKPLAEGRKRLRQALDLWKQKDYSGADKAFARFLREKLDPDVRRQAEFLQARMWLDAKAYDQAAARFDKLIASLPVLADWSRFFSGQARFKAGRWDEALAAFAAVAKDFARSRQAAELTCRALSKKADHAGLVACVDGLRAEGTVPASLLLEQAESLAEQNLDVRCAEVVREILRTFPAADEAEAAQKLAARLKKKGLPEEQLALTAEDQLGRTRSLLAKFNYSQAIAAADSLLAAAPRGGDLWCEALGLKATAWARRREETKSQPFFQQWVADCPDSLTAETLFRGIDAAAKAGKLDNAEPWTALLVKSFPESSLCDDALFLVARLTERDGDAAAARGLVDSLLAAYPSGDMAVEAAWLAVFSRYAAGELDEAFAAAERFEEVLPARADYRSDGRLAYWRGRIRQQQGRDDEAGPFYERVLRDYPLGWYALLSYLRLEQRQPGTGRTALQEARKDSAATLPSATELLAAAACWNLALEAGLTLLSLGLEPEAQDELRAALARPTAASGRELDLFSAFLYDRAGAVSRSHQILRRQVPQFFYAWPQETDDRWWIPAYPRPFGEPVEKAHESEKVPVSLIRAIMREESGFDPKIVSYAHAVGLMQLLEKTASGMARRDVSARELYQPELNVALGTKYVRYLLDRFGHPVLAVAGYNSGPGGVLRTLKRTTGREIDEFVEWIPYDQTSRYTKRVLSSAWVYQVLYGDTEGPAPFPLTFPKQKKGK
jgi:soluble lytic murein transglycosylase